MPSHRTGNSFWYVLIHGATIWIEIHTLDPTPHEGQARLQFGDYVFRRNLDLHIATAAFLHQDPTTSRYCLLSTRSVRLTAYTMEDSKLTFSGRS